MAGSSSEEYARRSFPALTPEERADMITVGGPVKRACVSLRVFGDEVEPSEISRALGCESTLARRKGETGRPGHEATTGSWILDLGSPVDVDIARQIQQLLDRVTSNIDVWAALGTRFRIDVFCGVWLTEPNSGFSLPLALLRKLLKRGLRLEFDLYCV